MRIGIDFDNTIACHDRSFYQAAVDRGLIPPSVTSSKEAVRDYLRQAGREDDWTELQGFIYGPGMTYATPFPGIREFLQACREAGVAVSIISHRTRHPFRGPAHDLHEAAWRWLEVAGLARPEDPLVPVDQIFFETTKEKKLERIAQAACTHFIDDLPELLAEPKFPSGVARYLFDPHGKNGSSDGWRRAGSWGELRVELVPEMTPVPISPEAAARRMTAGLGVPGRPSLTPLAGGMNNRVFRVSAEGGFEAVLKQYFQHPADHRNRLQSEYQFLTYAASKGLTAVPAPLARDDAAGLGLYSFVPGRRPTVTEITAAVLAEAVSFYRELNRDRSSPDALALPLASEACFSLEEHLATVDRRVANVGRVREVGETPAPVVTFVTQHLEPSWQRLREEFLARVGSHELPVAEALAPGDRRISPSDFGFHNALIDETGRVSFLDFEYAGWDDPAKLVCDFACQPAVPVPEPRVFFEGVAHDQADPERFVQRAALLLPLYRVKWACILLNEFLPVSAARRRFSSSAGPDPARERIQLEKAREMLVRT